MICEIYFGITKPYNSNCNFFKQMLPNQYIFIIYYYYKCYDLNITNYIHNAIES